jgi:hypothetical protein
MNERHSPPGFDLPPRQPETAEGSAGATPARLVAWLDSVPTHDPMAALKRLLDVARIMNRTTIGYVELLELTDRLDARAGPVLGRIESRLRNLHPPQEGNDRPLAETHAELLQELATSHLRLVEEGSEQERLSAPDIGRHLRRALVLTGCMCLQYWRLHELEPEGTWRRIHRIVAFAQELGLVSDPGTGDAGGLAFAPDSIERVAARIGVLAASHVWSLHPDEIETLAQWVQSLPVQCSDPSAAAGTMPETSARLWMSLDGDAPPSLIVGAPPAEDASALHIELQPVIAALRATPPKAPSAAQQGTEPLDRRLRKRWAVPLVTQFNEGPAHAGPLVAVTGLFESHALIHADIVCKRSPSAVMSNLMPGGFFAASVDDPLGIPEVFKAGLGYREARGTMDIGGKAPPVMQEVEWLSPRRLQHLVETWESTLREDDDEPGPRWSQPQRRMPCSPAPGSGMLVPAMCPCCSRPRRGRSPAAVCWRSGSRTRRRSSGSSASSVGCVSATKGMSLWVRNTSRKRAGQPNCTSSITRPPSMSFVPASSSAIAAGPRSVYSCSRPIPFPPGRASLSICSARSTS